MLLPVLSKNKGFTLVECLVAILIMTVGLLGLLQTVNISISHNMVSQLRLDGTVVADRELSREQSKGGSLIGFDSISTPTTPYVSRYNVRRTVLNGFRNYSVTKTNTIITTNTKQVTVLATWQYKGNRYRHETSSLISKLQ